MWCDDKMFMTRNHLRLCFVVFHERKLINSSFHFSTVLKSIFKRMGLFPFLFFKKGYFTLKDVKMLSTSELIPFHKYIKQTSFTLERHKSSSLIQSNNCNIFLTTKSDFLCHDNVLVLYTWQCGVVPKALKTL